MRFSLHEAFISAGSPTGGSQLAFTSLAEAGIVSLFGDDSKVCRMNRSPFYGCEYKDTLKHLREVLDVSGKLYSGISKALCEGCYPIVIGGDHSIAIGSIAAAANVFGYDNISVVYIDGHTDINTDRTSLTGYIHGMPLACAMGLCCDELTIGNKVNLLGRNTYIIGARSMDDGEYPIIESQNVHLYTAERVKRDGVGCVMDEVLASIDTKHIIISFDVDSIDENEFPSTGYRMPNGLSLSEVTEILQRTVASKKTAMLECVEYNPLLDKDYRDREKLTEIFRTIKKHL